MATFALNKIVPRAEGKTPRQYSYDTQQGRFIERVKEHYRPISERKKKLLTFVARLAKLSISHKEKKHLSSNNYKKFTLPSGYEDKIDKILARDTAKNPDGTTKKLYKLSKNKYAKQYKQIKQDMKEQRPYTHRKRDVLFDKWNDRRHAARAHARGELTFEEERSLAMQKRAQEKLAKFMYKKKT